MKALQSSRLLEVACQPRFPSLKTMLLTKSKTLGWGKTAMSSSLLPREQDAGRNGAGSQPKLSGFVAPTPKERVGAEKEPAQPLQESFPW